MQTNPVLLDSKQWLNKIGCFKFLGRPILLLSVLQNKGIPLIILKGMSLGYKIDACFACQVLDMTGKTGIKIFKIPIT